MRRILSLATVLVAAAACQPTSAEFSEEQKAAIADSVTQLSAEMQRAFDNEDAAYFDYFSEWTTTSAAGRRAHEQNRSETVDNYWANNTQISESGQPRTVVLSPDAVVVERAQVNTVTGSDGETQEYDVLLSELWVREEAGWKAILYKFTELGVR